MNEDSPLLYILKGLIPYTDANLKLVYKPNAFFNELERIDRTKKLNRSRNTFKSAYYRAINDNYISIDSEGRPTLTDKGDRKLMLYTPDKLKGSSLIVIFDIAERDRYKRTQLRQVLRILKFKQVQKSVWQSEYDGRDILKEELRQLGLNEEVIIYEARKL